ncbi:MAG: hypothetical protein IMY84_04075, partial [Chloroflexi bacterium]|nr:hypothetical protein [Chloroflexota bacterium]
MRKAILALCSLVLLSGCSYIMPQSNQPPKAYIDEISPSEVVAGGEVSFNGHGTDADGQIVAYRWRSDKDGELSSEQSFETSSLSVGDHIVFFKVQDNNDAWSAEVRSVVRVLPGITGPAKIDFFTASPQTIAEGGSATLSWSTTDSTDVSINHGIGEVEPAGAVSVSPASSTTYTLTAEGGGSTASAQVTVTVEAEELSIVFFEADPEEVASGEVSTLSWETTGATEAKILPIIGQVDPTGSEEVTLTGEQTVTFTLTATNGVDTVSATVDVESYLEMPDSYTVTLEAEIEESGYVRSTGVPWEEYIYVGDDTNDIGIQAFLTFDMSDIPDDATIAGVVVDFSDYNTPLGKPFVDLGCLRAYVDDYGTLDGGDYFDGTPVGAIGKYCDFDDFDAHSDDDFKDALQ